MNLPPISPVKTQGSALEGDHSPSIFKRGDAAMDSSSPKYLDQDAGTVQPKYMTGYGGFQPQQDLAEDIPRVIVSPVVGYTGNYRGKNIGKLGRCEVHRTRLSAWEKDTVSGILGVPHTHNDWEYSHYTNGCGNFAEKKYHEGAVALSDSFVSSVGSLSLASNSGGGASGDQFPDGLAAATSARNSPSLLHLHYQREETETDRILLLVQQGLETKFKTSHQARSALKAAFFGLDRQRSGLLPKREFFLALHKVAGMALPEEKCTHLAYALSAAGRRLSGSGELYTHSNDDQADESDAEYVNYGRFLNILVPRAAGGDSPGFGSARRRLSVSATAASKLSPMAHA